MENRRLDGSIARQVTARQIMVLVDTNVLIDVFEKDPQWSEWSVRQLRAQAQTEPLVINGIIYAELAGAFSSIETLDAAVDGLQLQLLPLSRPALFLAGKAYTLYRRRGGGKNQILGDFVIGAHASVLGAKLLTRDRGRYASYFPKLRLITPATTH